MWRGCAIILEVKKGDLPLAALRKKNATPQAAGVVAMMKTIGLFQPLVRATILAIGCAIVWGFVSSWLADTVRKSLDEPASERFYSLAFLADGTPLVEADGQYRDVDGNPRATPAADEWLLGA